MSLKIRDFPVPLGAEGRQRSFEIGECPKGADVSFFKGVVYLVTSMQMALCRWPYAEVALKMALALTEGDVENGRLSKLAVNFDTRRDTWQQRFKRRRLACAVQATGLCAEQKTMLRKHL